LVFVCDQAPFLWVVYIWTHNYPLEHGYHICLIYLSLLLDKWLTILVCSPCHTIIGQLKIHGEIKSDLLGTMFGEIYQIFQNVILI
jgi:hypothetical protein